jgi:hypothetical protein
MPDRPASGGTTGFQVAVFSDLEYSSNGALRYGCPTLPVAECTRIPAPFGDAYELARLAAHFAASRGMLSSSDTSQPEVTPHHGRACRGQRSHGPPAAASQQTALRLPPNNGHAPGEPGGPGLGSLINTAAGPQHPGYNLAYAAFLGCDQQCQRLTALDHGKFGVDDGDDFCRDVAWRTPFD